MRIGIVIKRSPVEDESNQEEKLKRNGIRRIHTFSYQRKKFIKEFEALISKRRKKDEIVFSSISNLDLTITALILQFRNSQNKGISLTFLNERRSIGPGRKITSKDLIEFLSNFHEQRLWGQQELKKRKRKSLRLSGRPKSLKESQVQKIMKDYDRGNLNVVDLCKKHKIARRTFYRYLSERAE